MPNFTHGKKQLGSRSFDEGEKSLNKIVYAIKNAPEYTLRNALPQLLTLMGVSGAVASVFFSIPFALGIGAGCSVASYFPIRTALQHIRRNKIKHLNQYQLELIDTKIQTMSDCESALTVNFVFNTDLDWKASDKSIIQPMRLQKKILDSLIATFNKPRLKEVLTLPRIDISHAEMSDNHLETLLLAGMGKYGTKILALKDNELTNASVAHLKKAIVDGDSSFQNLKTLDLSGNDLTGACLNDLAAIVAKLNIEELILSDNKKLCLNNPLGFVSFIRKINTELPSIKRLELKNVGMSRVQLEEIGKILSSVTLLEYLDIRDNDKLEASDFILHVKKKLKHNISLKTLMTDYDNILPKMTARMNDHNHAFSEINSPETEGQPIVIQLLNRLQQSEPAIPNAMASLINGNESTRTLLNDILNKIKTAREHSSEIKLEESLPVSESEYIQSRRRS